MAILALKILGLVAAGFVGLCILRFLFRHPEITFALFIFSYVIEGGDIIPGPIDLTPILLLISIAGFFLPAVIRNSIQYSSKSSDIWLLIFLILLVGGSYLAPDSQSGVKKAILFAIAVIFPYMIARIFLKTNKQIKVFLITILTLAAGIAVILTYMSFLPTYTRGRLQLFEANPIPTATLFAVGLVIAVIGLSSDLLSKSRQSKAICVAIIPFCLYGILLSGVRGPLISVIVGLSLYIFIRYARQPRVWICIMGIALFLLLTLNISYPYIASKVPNIRDYSPEAIIQGRSFKDRLERYQAAIRLFAQRRWLGGGTNSYEQRTNLDEYPHNIFLEIASENGLIGLVVFLGFLGSIAWPGFRYLATQYSRLDPHERAIGLVVFVVSLTLLVEKQFSYNLTMHKELFAFLGIAVNLTYLSKRRKVIKPILEKIIVRLNSLLRA